MTSKEEFKKSRAVQLWLAEVRMSRTGSDKTQRMYAKILPRFAGFAEMSPDELVADAVRSIEPGKKNHGETLAQQWFAQLVKEGKSRNYAKTCYGVVRSFYRANNCMFMGKTPSATPMQRYTIPLKDTLQKAWRLSDPITKIRIGILNDTGMRPEDAIELDYGDIKASLIGNKANIYIEKVSGKEKVKFAVCLSRPVTELVYQHIRDREKDGEAMTDETLLMTRAKIARNKKTKEPITGPITGNQLWRDVRDFGAKVGAKMSPKTFRKRFRTYGSPIVGTDAICMMGGWKLSGVGNHYYLPSEEETRKLYAKLEEALCLEEPRDARNVEAQRSMAYEVLKAAGLDPEKMLREANVGGKVEEAAFLTKTMVDTLRRGNGNGAQELVKTIADAVAYAKSMEKKETDTAR